MPSTTPILRRLLRPTRPRLSPQPRPPRPPPSSSSSTTTPPHTNTPPNGGATGTPAPSWVGHPLRLILTTLKFVAFTHLLWEYVISMAPASGPSMLPTFEVLGEWLLVSKLHRFGRGVAVGDVVAYNIPINDEVGVKRVLGLPGDYVLMETPADHHGADGGVGAGAGVGSQGGGGGSMIQVPKGHCWIVGDNLVASRDSRYFGPVPLALIRGKVIATVRPFSEFRWIDNALRKADSPDED
ncbi:peptidase S24/S26A/S26B/S26C [Parachaetomium inaequale]|uniref:Mitochondrial inner membrane protease subunit n=1 Tax=Parachaetomium inaequale TaxID=2588326 RepID=A0AAN6PMV3_9PEZI|nr:peptidase S24/S26A/S26B/S26C [Parachaetomium inaequale]